MYCDGMGYMIERRRRGKNIAGGEADRRNPRIAAPSTNEPRSGGKRTNGGETPYAREPYILYTFGGYFWRGEKGQKCIEKTSLFSIHFWRYERGLHNYRVLPGLTRHLMLSKAG